jgi:hypothetical protein
MAWAIIMAWRVDAVQNRRQRQHIFASLSLVARRGNRHGASIERNMA